MLERLLRFWKGKLFVLVLLGFAATDFIITMTLSAADATRPPHREPQRPLDPAARPRGRDHPGPARPARRGLPARLHRGDRHRGRARRGLPRAQRRRDRRSALWQSPPTRTVVPDWSAALTQQHGNPLMMVAVALMVFPKLALGLSGFETGVAVMPHVSGDPSDTEARPAGRIRGTKRLLTTAAVMMSVFLVTSSFVTTLLIPAGGVRGRRPGQRARAGLPGARVPRQRLRHGVRRLDDRDPLVRRRLRDGRHAEPDPPLPPPLRHGAGVGRRRAAAGAGAHRHGVPDHLDLRRRRRRARAAPTRPACSC